MIEIAFYILILTFMGTFAIAGISAAPWFATWSRDIKRIMKLAHIKEGEKFYDLGCGDGKLVFIAAKHGATAIGYEISLLPYLIAKLKSLKLKNANIIYASLWKARLGDADVVYIFLTPKIIPTIKKKFEEELKPGTRIIAYTWPIPGWTSVQEDHSPGRPDIYLYRIAS